MDDNNISPEEIAERDHWIAEKTAELVANGFFDISIDHDGEFGFKMSDEAEDIDPVTYDLLTEIHTEEIQEELNDLVGRGLIEVSGISEEGEEVYTLTSLGHVVAESFQQ